MTSRIDTHTQHASARLINQTTAIHDRIKCALSKDIRHFDSGAQIIIQNCNFVST